MELPKVGKAVKSGLSINRNPLKQNEKHFILTSFSVCAFATGSSFGAIESVKGASDLYSPVNGEVVESNADVAANPAQVNTSPYGSGWLIKVKVSGENKDLLDESAYSAWVKEQQH